MKLLFKKILTSVMILTIACTTILPNVCSATTLTDNERSVEYIDSLATFKSFVNRVNSGSDYSNKTVRLTTDIELDGTTANNIEPINGFKGGF